MGCAPSEPRDNNLHQHFANPPPLSVRIGNGVRHGDGFQRHIIFIFGGPGSQKGLVIEELTQRFDFTSITVEEIIFNCLPDKVDNTVETAADIQKMLKDDSGTLSVEWIFSMISDKLDASKHQRFVVDIVPSVTSISRADSFFDSNHERCLEEFEKLNPVMFALVLEVSEDVALQERNGNAVKEKKNDINKTTNENNQFDKDIDKGDRGKLEKRIHLYSLCSQPFIDYFKQTQRVISVTVPGSATNVASTVSTILIDHGFIEQQQPGRVVLFGVDQESFNNIDFEYYKMRQVRLSDIVKDQKASMTQQIRSLSRFIASVGAPDENFAVLMDTMNNTEIEHRRSIHFYEETSAFLDEFIKNRANRHPKIRVRLTMNTITSPSHDTLLFLDRFPRNLAFKIGLLFNDKVIRAVISLLERYPLIRSNPLSGMG